MTASADKADPIRDIEKNLFFDYYQDNLLKFITEDYRQNAVGQEKEPSGQGINYKNFAEVIILYALNRKELTVRERMLLADRLTRECTGKGRRRVAKERPKFTEIYKAYFFEDIMDMEEEELAEYIMENYDIPKGTKLNTVWDVVSEQVTATHITQELLWDLKEVYRETDISIGIKNWTKGGHGSIDFRKDKDFMKILEKMRARLQIKKTRKEWLDEQLAAAGCFRI